MKIVKIVLTVVSSAILVLALVACAAPYTQSPDEIANDLPLNTAEDTGGGEEVVNDLPLDATEDTSEGIIVLGEPLEGYLPSVDGFDGVILVPLFPIAQRLGIETYWNEEEQMARVGEDISIWVGKDYYVKGEGDPVTFGPAPQLIDDILYVPIYFFQFVVGGYEAHVADGAVIIERMAQ